MAENPGEQFFEASKPFAYTISTSIQNEQATAEGNRAAHICCPLLCMGELGQNSMESDIRGCLSASRNMGQQWNITMTILKMNSPRQLYSNAERYNSLLYCLIVHCTASAVGQVCNPPTYFTSSPDDFQYLIQYKCSGCSWCSLVQGISIQLDALYSLGVFDQQFVESADNKSEDMEVQLYSEILSR